MSSPTRSRSDHEVEDTVADGETGEHIFVWGRIASIALHPAGTAKVQFTLSKTSLVKAGTARWLDWARGDITSAAADIPEGPVTAVRAVSITGAATLEVVLQ